MTTKRVAKVLSLDAFNTLVVPRSPIISQYVKIASRYGIDTTEREISERFPSVMKEMRSKFPNYGKGIDGMNNTEWWRRLIQELYKPLKISSPAIDEIIETFESKKGYATYADVLTFLKKVQKYKQEGGIIFVILASDGEPRITKVLNSLGLMEYIDHVYLSYDIEKFKPSHEFYDYIYSDLIRKYQDYSFEKYNFWHVGDEEVKDFEASYNAGWNGILLDRTKELNEYLEQIKNEEEKQTLIKLATNYENTKNIGEFESFIKRKGDRRYVTNSFEGVSTLLEIN